MWWLLPTIHEAQSWLSVISYPRSSAPDEKKIENVDNSSHSRSCSAWNSDALSWTPWQMCSRRNFLCFNFYHNQCMVVKTPTFALPPTHMRSQNELSECAMIMKHFAPSVVFVIRLKATWKWPIGRRQPLLTNKPSRTCCLALWLIWQVLFRQCSWWESTVHNNSRRGRCSAGSFTRANAAHAV